MLSRISAVLSFIIPCAGFVAREVELEVPSKVNVQKPHPAVRSEEPPGVTAPAPVHAHRPPNIILGRNDAVPVTEIILGGLQHTALILGVGIALPLAVLAQVNLDPVQERQMMSLALLTLAIGTLMQITTWRAIGCGYLVPAVFTAVYVGPCIAAIDRGGPGLVAGMLMFSGLLEAVLAPALKRLRPYLPPEIGGLAVLMIGIVLGLLGVRLMAFGEPSLRMSIDDAAHGPPGVHGVWLGIVTVVTIVVLSVWMKGAWRTYATLIGITAGLLSGIATGLVRPGQLLAGVIEGGLALPALQLPTPSFDISLAPQFIVAALVCSLRAMGDVITAQKVERTDYIRPEPVSLRGGVLADGLGTVMCGLLGSPIGLNTFSGSVGLASATGVTARRVGWGIAAWLGIISLLPGAAAAFINLPKAILGGVLLVSASHIVFNGILVIVSRMVDARRMLMLGIPLLLGLSVDASPQAFSKLPAWLELLGRSDVMVAVFGALLINGLFRLGVSQSARLELPDGRVKADEIEAWVNANGATWGARVEVMRSVSVVLRELVDAGPEWLARGRPITIEMRFDEFQVDVTVSYHGQVLDPALARALDAADLDDLESLDLDLVQARLRANLILRLPAQTQVRRGEGDRQVLAMRFEH
jgi:NCS2 family nucleobase:cation symporter-2